MVTVLGMETTTATARSAAWKRWRSERVPRLETVSRLAAAAHARPDRADEADLLTQMYVIVLTAEFQGFATELLLDIRRALVNAMPAGTSPVLREVVGDALQHGLSIRHRNPSTATLTTDFSRFGIQLRRLLPGSGDVRLLTLHDQVIADRNALAHGKNTVADPGGRRGPITPDLVDEWRRGLDRLAATLDSAVAAEMYQRLTITIWRGKEPA